MLARKAHATEEVAWCWILRKIARSTHATHGATPFGLIEHRLLDGLKTSL